MARMTETSEKKTFLSGVLLLTVSTVLVKLVGLLYKIPMLSYLGSEGMGYFNSAYEIYALFSVISTAGLPVALSVLISGARARGEEASVSRIYRAALGVFLAIGTVGSGLMLLFAHRFSLWIRSEGAYLSILAISPTVLLVCISSALRGYFQGYQRMLPTALSQLIEAVGKLVLGLALARFALTRGYDTPTVAAFAGIGLTLGTALSTLYLLIEKLRQKSDAIQGMPILCSYRTVWRGLGRLAIPMTLGASLVSMTKLIDMTMILRRLQSIGYTEVTANEAYGSYTTLALSVFGLIPTLVNSVALPLVPMLSAAIAAGDRERQADMIRTSYRLTALFAIPAALGLSAYAEPILSLLFGGDAAAVATAAPLLSCLGISVFLSCMITATNSVLHAYQAVNRPILAMLAGAVVKIISAYFLIGHEGVALLGAPISTFLCNTTVVVCNLFFASRLCDVSGLGAVFWKPTLCATVAIGVSYVSYLLLGTSLGGTHLPTLLALLCAVVLYFVLSLIWGVFSEEDIRALPGGERLLPWIQKLRLLPS